MPTSGKRRPPTSSVGVVGQRAAHAVAVPDRHGGEHRLLPRHEATPVAGALAGRAGLDLGDVAGELQRGLEVARGGILLERVEAVDRDARAHEVEVAVDVAQQRGGVRGVQDQARVALAQRGSPCGEALELLAEEVVAELVGGGEVGHRGHQLDARLRGGRLRHARGLLRVTRPQPSHPGVELDVHAPAPARGHRGDELLAPRDDVGARRQCAVELLGAQRTEDEQRRVDAVRAQLRGLVGRRHRQPRGAAGQGGVGRGRRAVAVAIGLDHRAQRGAAAQLATQTDDVALDRGDVDPGQRPQRAHCSRVSGSRMSGRVTAICRAGV